MQALFVFILAGCFLAQPAPARADILKPILAEVSAANVEAHVRALAASPRDTPATQAAAADYIAGQLESWGYSVTREAVGDSENVIANLPGTRTPERVFVVGAHFDTVPGSPGADDNASGVAGMLEIARVLAGRPMVSTIQFVAFAHEEIGLVGSTVRAGALKAQGADVAGMLALEMIGYTCGAPCQFVFTEIEGCLDLADPVSAAGDWIGHITNTASFALRTTFLEVAKRYVRKLPNEAGTFAGLGTCLFGSGRRSDHAPFWDEGYPAAMITDTANFRNTNYHAATDTPDTLDFAFATQVTRATLAAVLSDAGYFDLSAATGSVGRRTARFTGKLHSPLGLAPQTAILTVTLRDGANVLFTGSLPPGSLAGDPARRNFSYKDLTGGPSGIAKVQLKSRDGLTWSAVVGLAGAPLAGMEALADGDRLTVEIAIGGDGFAAPAPCRLGATGGYRCRP